MQRRCLEFRAQVLVQVLEEKYNTVQPNLSFLSTSIVLQLELKYGHV